MSLTSNIPHYTKVMDDIRAELDAIKSSTKELPSDYFHSYLQLKTAVPRGERQDLRNVFLKFQDRSMMDKYIALYL
jgi:hypothetical protein